MPKRTLMAALERVPGCPGEQDHGGERSQQDWFDDEPEREYGKEDDRYHQRVTKPNWEKCQPNDALTAAIQAERHREQPAPRRVDAVKQAECRDREPEP
jgi:hypothetical protein